jgi:small subunit ribosomal protein S4e
LGNKGPTKHLKRHKSPDFWPIHRKSGKWTFRTSSGPHGINTSLPITIVLRNVLGYAKSAKEAKMLVKMGKIVVDGKTRFDEKFPVGLMDVIYLPDTEEVFRVLPDHGGKLKLHPISKEEVSYKLCQIAGKTSIPGNKIQLNLHDGKNIIINNESDNYRVNDVIKINVPEQEILDHIEFKEMTQVIIIGGRSQGAKGILIGLGPEPGWKKTAVIRTIEGEDIRTLSKYVFVVGEKESLISLEGVKN